MYTKDLELKLGLYVWYFTAEEPAYSEIKEEELRFIKQVFTQQMFHFALRLRTLFISKFPRFRLLTHP